MREMRAQQSQDIARRAEVRSRNRKNQNTNTSPREYP